MWPVQECAWRYGSSDLPHISRVNVLTFQISTVLKCAERTELLRLPVKRESWLGGWRWVMMRGGYVGGLYSRNKEFLFPNNGLKQTLHGHRLFDGMFLV